MKCLVNYLPVVFVLLLNTCLTKAYSQLYSSGNTNIVGFKVGIGVSAPNASLDITDYSQSLAGGNPAIPLIRLQSTSLNTVAFSTNYWDFRMDLGTKLTFWHHTNLSSPTKVFELGFDHVKIHSKLEVGEFSEYGSGMTPNGTQGYNLSLGLRQVSDGIWNGSGSALFSTNTGELQILTNSSGTISGPSDLINNVRMMIHHSGVSIGTTYLPNNYTLSVDGTAIFTKIVIREISDWPDFVFEKEYDLRSLQEVEAFIVQNGHLPEVPSAAEVHKEGMDVIEINKILILKVEELTLYLIQLDARLAQMESNH